MPKNFSIRGAPPYIYLAKRCSCRGCSHVVCVDSIQWNGLLNVTAVLCRVCPSIASAFNLSIGHRPCRHCILYAIYVTYGSSQKDCPANIRQPCARQEMLCLSGWSRQNDVSTSKTIEFFSSCEGDFGPQNIFTLDNWWLLPAAQPSPALPELTPRTSTYLRERQMQGGSMKQLFKVGGSRTRLGAGRVWKARDATAGPAFVGLCCTQGIRGCTGPKTRGV